MTTMADQGGYEERYYRLKDLHESVVLKRYASAHRRDKLKALLLARILNEFLSISTVRMYIDTQLVPDIIPEGNILWMTR